MQVFLSWSGAESKRAATVLKPWLERLLPGVTAWMSERDIEAGSSWNAVLHAQLRRAQFGVLCITAENLNAPWILYEAGALAMSSREGCVVPYLLGVRPDLLPAALAQFQAVLTDREGTWRLIRSIVAVKDDSRPENDLRAAFDVEWSPLAESLGLSIEFDLHEGGVGVRLTNGQIGNLEEMSALFQSLRSRWRAGQRRTVIDMSKVTNMPSGNGECVGLGFILRVSTYARREEARVVFVGLTGPILELFEMTKIDKMIKHYDVLDDALKSF
jgi:anti-anti-sigma regulatory factor